MYTVDIPEESQLGIFDKVRLNRAFGKDEAGLRGSQTTFEALEAVRKSRILTSMIAW
jgi:hypothetical protein